MKKLAIFAVIPLFAGFLCAQSSQTTETRTTTTTTRTNTWNGVLVDAGCMSKHSENKETTTTPEGSTTTTTRESTYVDCPVSSSTTQYGLRTADGRFLRFDEPSSTKVIEIVKHNKTWTDEMNNHKPVNVRVVGTPNGDMIVVESVR